MRIRKAKPDDAQFIANIENDPALMEFLGGSKNRSPEEYRQFLSKSALSTRNPLQFLIIECLKTGHPIGTAGLWTGFDGNKCQDYCEFRVIRQNQAAGHNIGFEVATRLKDLAVETYPNKLLIAKIKKSIDTGQYNKGALHIISQLGFIEDAEEDGWRTFHLPLKTNN